MAYIRCSGNIGGSLKVRTASGNPCTFTTDLADALVSLTADIVAKQDLHGYDHPWAGGAGKNKTDISDNTISGAGYVIGGFPVAINSDNVILPSGNYVFSFDVQNATFPCACQLIWYKNGVEVGNIVETVSSSGINTIPFTASGEFDSIVMFCNSSSGGAFTNFNLNIGSTPSAYEPYANICPIVGHSELNLTRAGVNLLAYSPVSQGVSISGTEGDFTITSGTQGGFNCAYFNITNLKGLGTLYFSGEGERSQSYSSDIAFQLVYYSNGSYHFDAMGFYGNNNKCKVKDVSFVLSNDIEFAYLQCYINNTGENSQGKTANFKNIIISKAQNSNFEPYNGQTFTVAFGQTVYGGVYDANAGKLTCIKGYLLLNGTETWYAEEGYVNRFSHYSGIQKSSNYANDLSNMFVTSLWGTSNGTFAMKSSGAIYLTTDNTAPQQSVDDFKSWLSNNNLQIAYELATPIVIDVPSISVFAEKGVNNIVSDCGGDVSVSYLELIRGT